MSKGLSVRSGHVHGTTGGRAWGIHGSLIVSREPSVRCIDSHVVSVLPQSAECSTQWEKSLSRESKYSTLALPDRRMLFIFVAIKTKRIFRQERDTRPCSSLARRMQPTREILIGTCCGQIRTISGGIPWSRNESWSFRDCLLTCTVV